MELATNHTAAAVLSPVFSGAISQPRHTPSLLPLKRRTICVINIAESWKNPATAPNHEHLPGNCLCRIGAATRGASSRRYCGPGLVGGRRGDDNVRENLCVLLQMSAVFTYRGQMSVINWGLMPAGSFL
ncbi:hypothetical protein CFC21_069569 [Triticum aestivum]|uniref:Uncharacterized protein n=2 Tax=Triticum aestivum TaxID=4565 RepID=A0A9R1KQW5_WHEAT|nr:hypothetical protein CFC21_069569 [Triticum aestivum]